MMPTARDQLFIDLFTTAMEGGIGYWSQAESYHRLIQPGSVIAGGPPYADAVDDYYGFYADLLETDEDVDEDEWPHHRLDRQVIHRGYHLASTTHRNKIRWSTEPPPLVITDDTDWDFDAGDADCIVQLGLFGEVRYG